MTFDASNTPATEQSSIEVTHKWVRNTRDISKETIINMLVNKGICTADELFDMECHIREARSRGTNGGVVVNINKKKEHSRFDGLKRKMSKRRWTRRLGTTLFGWKWKKVKIKDDSIFENELQTGS